MPNMTLQTLLPEDSTSNDAQFAFDDENEEWIPFKSTTDALVAKLHLEAQIPPRYIDTFLELMRRKDFNASKLSFSRTTDIDNSIADFRKHRARERAKHYEFPTTRLPFDIFTHIVDQIAAERLPLRTDDPSSCFGVRAIGESRTELISSRLKVLALVHRSLTPLAQRALGERIFVQQKEHLVALARSPLLGPWTSELVINTHFAPPVVLTPEEIMDCAISIIRRAPHLRFLRIKTAPYLDEEGAQHLKRLLEAIGELKSLEVLWWMARDKTSRFAKVDVEDVCRVISGMPRLRTLALRNVRCGWVPFGVEDANATEVVQALIPHKLENLSLTNVEFVVHNAPMSLSWLLSPTTPILPTLTSLTIDLTSVDTILAVLSTSTSVLANLQVLRLRVSRPLPSHISACLFSPFTPSSPLHTVQLWVSPSFTTSLVTASAFFSHLPACVRTLHLSFYQLGEQELLWAQQESQLEAFLAHPTLVSLPDLRTLKIDMPLMRVPWMWNRLGDVCRKRKVDVVVRRDSHAGFS